MADLSIVYEHPLWFEPLFAALQRRGVAFDKVGIQDHWFDPEDAPPSPVIFNRLAMSAVSRHAEHPIFYAQALFAHWEGQGARVLNGSKPLAVDSSKARQLALLRRLGFGTPRTRVVHRRADLTAAVEGLRFPVMVKANIGGSGAGMVRYDSLEELRAAAEEASTPVGVDGVALAQEYLPARDGCIIRCETLAGRFLYALEVSGAGESFDLCPADVCAVGRADSGAPRISMRGFTPPAEIVHAVEAIAAAAHLDVGGVEYMVDDRDGSVCFYDINALSNFVADPHAVLGYDPHDNLVSWLVEQIGDAKGRAA